MFHEGDLQSGIALAVQQSKAVLCFVHDHEENSKSWEEIISKDDQVVEAVRRNAVALRITAGSQEAVFLSSFCPFVAIPTVVVIQNGTMKGMIPHLPSTKDQLKARILPLLGLQQVSPEAGVIDAGRSATAAVAGSEIDNGTTSHATEGSSTSGALDRSVPVPTPATPSTPSTEGPCREESRPSGADKEQTEIASGQHPESPRITESTVPTKSSGDTKKSPVKSISQQDWAARQRERERQQREERERIKAQIRHDHAERRRLEELRRQPAVNLTFHDANNPAVSNARRLKSGEIRIQVRTFEGSTLRSSFPKTATIATHVRPWIDLTAKQKTPYNLKIILTPLPTRTIEAAEEEQSLDDLDITGSCTLVMVPVKGFVDSYAPPGSGIIGSTVSGGYSLLNGSIGAVIGGVRSVLGFGQVTAEQQPAPSSSEETVSRPSSGEVRVRTLADQRDEAQKKNQQFYNGNHLNFIPRGDSEDDKRD
ncbi:hypothetical protein GJ744_001915 [Endocarpon pusillum]|uniref:UBX domain-containing protein 2 n=1 Tax=Endocarpon pusillum TaxID=364733 RepID=A0A8H7ASV8_9EURO|nr:hypothetical protein GJ744_001915 [Endocarpon pusillum]